MPEKDYVKGSFILTLEHIQLAALAGNDETNLINDCLVNVEMDLLLIPESLVVYHIEERKDYKQYFYTEWDNKQFIQDFHFKMKGGNLMINPTLN